MATHSSILAWRIPWTEEPGGHSLRCQNSQTRLSMQEKEAHLHLYIPRTEMLFAVVESSQISAQWRGQTSTSIAMGRSKRTEVTQGV